MKTYWLQYDNIYINTNIQTYTTHTYIIYMNHSNLFLRNILNLIINIPINIYTFIRITFDEMTFVG